MQYILNDILCNIFIKIQKTKDNIVYVCIKQSRHMYKNIKMRMSTQQLLFSGQY